MATCSSEATPANADRPKTGKKKKKFQLPAVGVVVNKTYALKSADQASGDQSKSSKSGSQAYTEDGDVRDVRGSATATVANTTNSSETRSRDAATSNDKRYALPPVCTVDDRERNTRRSDTATVARTTKCSDTTASLTASSDKKQPLPPVLSNDKRPQRPATVAVTTATRRAAGAESRDLPQDMSEWKPSDVQKWLTMNNLNHLQLKFKGYDGTLLLNFIKVALKAPVSVYNALLRENLSTTDVAKLNRAITQLSASSAAD